MAPASAESKPAYQKDEKALCFHGELLYEAKILDLKKQDPKDKSSPFEYRVHYKGWKNTWDDWVPQDRLRKNTEENRELAVNLKKAAQEQNAPRSAKPAVGSKGKKGQNSDVGSGRGSEERNSSVPAGNRGTKRSRDNDIEKCGVVVNMTRSKRKAAQEVKDLISSSSMKQSRLRSSSVHESAPDSPNSVSNAQHDRNRITGQSHNPGSAPAHDKNIAGASGFDSVVSFVDGSLNADGVNGVLEPEIEKEITIVDNRDELLKRLRAKFEQNQPTTNELRYLIYTYTLTTEELCSMSAPKDEPEYVSKSTASKPLRLHWAPLISGTTMEEKNAIEEEMSVRKPTRNCEDYHPKYYKVQESDPNNTNKLLFYAGANPGVKCMIAGVPRDPLVLDPPGSNTPFDALKYPERLVDTLNRAVVETLPGWTSQALEQIPTDILAEVRLEVLARMPLLVTSSLPSSVQDKLAYFRERHAASQPRLDYGQNQGRSSFRSTQSKHASYIDLDSDDTTVSEIEDSDDPDFITANAKSGRHRRKQPENSVIYKLDEFENPLYHGSPIGLELETTRNPKNSACENCRVKHKKCLHGPDGKLDEQKSAQWINKIKRAELRHDRSKDELEVIRAAAQKYETGKTATQIVQPMSLDCVPTDRVTLRNDSSPPSASVHTFLIAQNGLRAEFKANASQEEAFLSRPSVRITIPDHLKNLLVDDWENVTKSLLLVPMPSKAPANYIIDEYFNQEKTNRRLGSAEADVLVEFLTGLKTYFEKSLGKILLYRFERGQLAECRKWWESGKFPEWEGKGPGDCYGAEHLARMLVNMPEMVAQTNMDAQSVARLKEELSKFSVWLSRNSSDFFCAKYEKPTPEYVENAR